MFHNSLLKIKAYLFSPFFKAFLNSEEEENIAGFIEEIIFLIISSFAFSSLIKFLLLSVLIILFMSSIILDSINNKLPSNLVESFFDFLSEKNFAFSFNASEIL